MTRRLRVLVTLLVLVLGNGSFASNDLNCNRGVVLCHWQSESHNRSSPFTYTVEDIPVHLCTHLVYSYAKVSASGLDYLDANFDKKQGGYERFIALKKRNPDLKLLLAIGDPSGNDEAFTVEENSGLRRFSLEDQKSGRYRLMMRKLTWFVQKEGFDGIHLNWQNLRGSSQNRLNFAKFAWYVKGMFRNTPGFLLSCSVPVYADDLETTYQLRVFPRIFTFIIASPRSLPSATSSNNSTSSLGAPEAKENSLVDSADISRLLRAGIPHEKILVEIPFYGRTRIAEDTNHSTSKYGNHAASTELSPYFEICNNLRSGWRRNYNPVARRPEAFHNDRRVVYDDEESIQERVQHVKDYRIGGVAAWGIDMDDVNGDCVRKNHLLKSINEELSGCSVPTDSPGESKDTARIAVTWPVTGETPSVTPNLGHSQNAEGATESSTLSHDDVSTTKEERTHSTAVTSSGAPAQSSLRTDITTNESEAQTETLFSTTSGEAVPSKSTRGFANTEGVERTVGVRATADISTEYSTAPSTSPWRSFTGRSDVKWIHSNTKMSAQSDGYPRETPDWGVSPPVTTDYDSMSTTGYTEEPHRTLTVDGALPSDNTGSPTTEPDVVSRGSEAGIPKRSTQGDDDVSETPEWRVSPAVTTAYDPIWMTGSTEEPHHAPTTDGAILSDNTDHPTTERYPMRTSSGTGTAKVSAQSDDYSRETTETTTQGEDYISENPDWKISGADTSDYDAMWTTSGTEEPHRASTTDGALLNDNTDNPSTERYAMRTSRGTGTHKMSAQSDGYSRETTERTTQGEDYISETADWRVSDADTTDYDSMWTTSGTEQPHRASTTDGALLSDSTDRPTTERYATRTGSGTGTPRMSAQSEDYISGTPDRRVSPAVTTNYDSIWTSSDTEEPHRTSTTGWAVSSDNTGNATTESQVVSTGSAKSYTNNLAEDKTSVSTAIPDEIFSSNSLTFSRTDSDSRSVSEHGVVTLTTPGLETRTPFEGAGVSTLPTYSSETTTNRYADRTTAESVTESTTAPEMVTETSSQAGNATEAQSTISASVTIAPHDNQYTSQAAFPTTSGVSFDMGTTNTVPPTRFVEVEVSPSIVCRDGQRDGLAHESNCNLYYSCRRGVAVLRRCPDGLVYDKELRECNNPESVQRPECKPSQKAHRVDLIRLLKSVVSEDFTPKKGEKVKLSLNYELALGE